jgi:hypothetical protein
MSTDEPDVPESILPGATPSIFRHPALAGFRLLRCEESNFFSEIWRAQAPSGAEKILYRYFGLTPQRAVDGLARFQRVSHAGLLPLEFLCGYGDQVVLLGEAHDRTLRDCFAGYWDRGMPGIPPHELLDHLRVAAATLDALFEAHGLLHLALRPRSLVFKDGQLLVNGFGLMQVLWLPDRWLAPRVNSRYAAPELFQRRITPKCDQYSLALIYAEMRTGVHPFARQSPPPTTEPDLGLLSSAEQQIIRTALGAQAYLRYPSCGDLIQALTDAIGTGESVAGAESPAVSMLEKPEPEAAAGLLQIVAADEQFLQALSTATLGKRELRFAGAMQYITETGVFLEHTLVTRTDQEQLLTVLTNLLARWDADQIELGDKGITFRLSAAPTWWAAALRRKVALRVRLDTRFARRERQEACVAVQIRIEPETAEPPCVPEMLEDVGLAFLRALRDQLRAAAEMRIHQRWEWREPVRVLPVYYELDLLHSVECVGKDLSTRGIGFVAPGWLPAAHVCLHLPWLVGYTDKAIRVTIVRCTPRRDGLFEVGAMFE